MSDIDLTPGAFALPEPIQPLDAPEAEANDEMKATQLPLPTGWKILCAVPDISERVDGTSLDLVRPIESMRQEETATTVLFVLKVGPDAYNDTAKFPNGAWCKEGDFVLVRTTPAQDSRSLARSSVSSTTTKLMLLCKTLAA